MTLDRFFILLCLSFLPVLWLPQQALLPVMLFATLLMLYFGFKHQLLPFMLGFIMLLSYGQVLKIANQAENFTAYKSTQPIEIIKILKQQEYQTAVGQLTSGQKIYLNWQAKTPLQLNATYQAELNLRPISGRSNIGNFDRQRWYFANDIDGLATVRKAEFAHANHLPLRTRWINRTYQQTETLETQGLLLALTFGERAWLKSEHWRIFQQTTTAHLITISGLHIALAFGFGFWFAKLVQWLMLSTKYRYNFVQRMGFSYLFPRLMGFAFALSYSYLAGFAIPTMRAIFAISLILLCQFARKHYTPSQFWWRIVAILLILDPITILSDSFWLSILAVASLILWYRYFPLKQFEWLIPHWLNRPFFKPVLSLLHLQMGIFFLFSPVQFFFFEGYSPLGFAANLLIVPLYSLVLVPMILFTLLTDNLAYTWQLADWLAQFSLWLIEPLSHSWITLSQQNQWHLLAFYTLILCGIYAKNWLKSWYFFAKLSGILASIYLAGLGYLKKDHHIEWITFDIGQGLAQALIYQNASGQKKAIFYDTGASWGEGSQRNSMANLEVLPYLKRNNIQIKAIFISHDDNDHSGGIADLLATYPHAQLFSSGQTAYAQRIPEPCVASKEWQFDSIKLTAIFPEQITKRAENQHSCTLLVEIDRLKLLFTGDAGVEQERIFSPIIGKIDFLQVGHHGSKTSTGEILVATTKPNIAVISVGRWNAWKMPNKNVVERLEKYGVQILDTSKVGMVKVIFEEGKYQIKTSRTRSSAWYQAYFNHNPKD